MGDEEKRWPQGGVVGQWGCQPGPDTSAHSQPGVRAASLVGAGTTPCRQGALARHSATIIISDQREGKHWAAAGCELTCVCQVCVSVCIQGGGSQTPAQELKGKSLIRTRAQRILFSGRYPGQWRRVPGM